MAVLSESSKERLLTCDPRLQRICEMAIRVIDFTVLEGHRGQEAQDLAFADGKSKLKWPNGNHNTIPAIAVDIAPYPIDWNDSSRFHLLAGIMLGIAVSLNIKIRWGGDWNQNNRSDDERFKDFPHFELYET